MLPYIDNSVDSYCNGNNPREGDGILSINQYTDFNPLSCRISSNESLNFFIIILKTN